MNPIVGKTYMFVSTGTPHINRIVVVLDKSSTYSSEPYCKLLSVYSFTRHEQRLIVYQDYMLDESLRHWELVE